MQTGRPFDAVPVAELNEWLAVVEADDSGDWPERDGIARRVAAQLDQRLGLA